MLLEFYILRNVPYVFYVTQCFSCNILRDIYIYSLMQLTFSTRHTGNIAAAVVEHMRLIAQYKRGTVLLPNLLSKL